MAAAHRYATMRGPITIRSPITMRGRTMRGSTTRSADGAQLDDVWPRDDSPAPR